MTLTLVLKEGFYPKEYKCETVPPTIRKLRPMYKFLRTNNRTNGQAKNSMPAGHKKVTTARLLLSNEQKKKKKLISFPLRMQIVIGYTKISTSLKFRIFERREIRNLEENGLECEPSGWQFSISTPLRKRFGQG